MTMAMTRMITNCFPSLRVTRDTISCRCGRISQAGTACCCCLSLDRTIAYVHCHRELHPFFFLKGDPAKMQPSQGELCAYLLPICIIPTHFVYAHSSSPSTYGSTYTTKPLYGTHLLDGRGRAPSSQAPSLAATPYIHRYVVPLNVRVM